MDQEQMSSLGQQVVRARKARGWTQEQLAEHAGVSQGPVGRIELGQPVRAGNLRAILDALGIEPVRPMDAGANDDEDVALALDIVRKWLLARPAEARAHEMMELTRWIMTRQ